MIKINLNSRRKSNDIIVTTGFVKVSGEVDLIGSELYRILKEFDEKSPEALELALELVVRNERRTKE